MVRNLLIKIGSDPQKSPRPAEAVRIGAGVGAWTKVKVHVLLEGPAVFCLDQFADELVQGELFTQYLPSILNHGGRILVDQTTAALQSIKPAVQFERVSAEEINAFRATVDHLMEF